MSKFYAVKIGRNPGIYNSWSECQQQVNGFKGAIFKSFKTKEEADNFINGEDNKKVASIDNLNENECVAYVDGSFKKDTGEYSFGCVLFHNSKIDKFNQKFPKSEFSTHRNFVKVKGHSNDTYNDMADELAKEALGIGK